MFNQGSGSPQPHRRLHVLRGHADGRASAEVGEASAPTKNRARSQISVELLKPEANQYEKYARSPQQRQISPETFSRSLRGGSTHVTVASSILQSSQSTCIPIPVKNETRDDHKQTEHVRQHNSPKSVQLSPVSGDDVKTNTTSRWSGSNLSFYSDTADISWSSDSQIFPDTESCPDEKDFCAEQGQNLRG